MYCILQYIDIKNEIEVSQSFTSLASIQTIQSANSNVTENKQLMFNPNCPIQIILDYIYSETGMDKTLEFDLCDLETGDILNIKQLKPWQHPTDIFKPKHTYIIVFYEKEQNGQYRKVEPFISRQTKQYPEILQKIKRRLSALRRMSTLIKKTKRESISSKASSIMDSTSSNKDVLRKKNAASATKNKKSGASQM